MNKKIASVVLVIFIVVFSGFFYFNFYFMDISEDKFYSQNFDSSKKKILIYGSSHLIQLNSTHVSERVQKISEDHVIFNMAENGDTPKRRSLNVENDLNIHPSLVVYGVGFRDFSLMEKNNENNELKLVDLIPFDVTEIELLNPKLKTLEVIRALVIDVISDDKKSNVPYPNTSVFSERVQEKIADIEFLEKNSGGNRDIRIPNVDNEQEKYFRDIINSFKKNNINVIVVLTPYHRIALEEMPQSEKENFFKIIQNVEKDFDVKIIDFSDKFSEDVIWRDTTHIAYNEKSIIFSEEFSDIIIQEIKK